MHRTPLSRWLLACTLFGGAGCPALNLDVARPDAEAPGATANDARKSNGRVSAADDDAGVSDEVQAPELDCSDGEGVLASFGCDRVVTTSCKDLSNVVLEFADGERQRFEGLHGHSASFGGTGEHEGKVIVRVWIKSGRNHSGEGPGYGTRFDAPRDACEPSGEVPGGDDPNGDDAGVPETEPEPEESCGDQPDESCVEPPPVEPPCDASNPESACYVIVPS